MLTENFYIQALIVIGSVATTYLTVKYKDHITGRGKPKDRMDQIFQGYENLIKQQQDEITRKTDLIDKMQALIDRQRNEMDKMESLIGEMKRELELSKEKAEELEVQLRILNRKYRDA